MWNTVYIKSIVEDNQISRELKAALNFVILKPAVLHSSKGETIMTKMFTRFNKNMTIIKLNFRANNKALGFDFE